MDVGLIPPLGIEAGTEPCPAQMIVGTHEDINTDNTRELSDDEPPSQSVIPPPATIDAGIEKKNANAGTDEGRGLLVRRKCYHDKKGHCSVHGGGARKLWRRIPCVTVNPGGVEVSTYNKKPYFECYLGPRGQGVLRQTQLSFSKTSITPTRTGEGHDRVGVSNYFNFSSTTVGQHGMNNVQTTDEQTKEG